MATMSISEICRTLDYTAALEHAAITLFDDTGRILYETVQQWGKGESIPEKMMRQNGPLIPASEETREMYFGKMQMDSGYYLLIGPLLLHPLGLPLVRKTLRGLKIEQDVDALPRISEQRCLHMLELLHYILTGQPLEYEKTEVSLERTREIKQAEREKETASKKGTIADRLLRYQLARVDRLPNQSASIERSFREKIIAGDTEGALAVMGRVDVEEVGEMAFTPKKSAEYEAVLLVSMLARYAIDADVPTQDAYDLNDLYLQQISIANTAEQYWTIEMNAIKDVCAYIRSVKHVSTDDYLVLRCKAYIRNHLKQDLSLEVLSRELGLHPAYLSHTFSVQSGMTIRQFIQQEKIEAAKNLLRFSEYSVSEIAHYLGFSSHSYFGSIFVKSVGKTPAQYRRDTKTGGFFDRIE